MKRDKSVISLLTAGIEDILIKLYESTPGKDLAKLIKDESSKVAQVEKNTKMTITEVEKSKGRLVALRKEHQELLK